MEIEVWERELDRALQVTEWAYGVHLLGFEIYLNPLLNPKLDTIICMEPVNYEECMLSTQSVIAMRPR